VLFYSTTTSQQLDRQCCTKQTLLELRTWEPKQFPSTPKQHGKKLLPSPTPKHKTQKTTQTKNKTQNTKQKIGCAHKNSFNNNQRKKRIKNVFSLKNNCVFLLFAKILLKLLCGGSTFGVIIKMYKQIFLTFTMLFFCCYMR
jgi:hypothetical protein